MNKIKKKHKSLIICKNIFTNVIEFIKRMYLVDNENKQNCNIHLYSKYDLACY